MAAGALSLAGGLLTLSTAGAALPVLAAGLGLGVASGLTGGGAALAKHILKSDQMSRCRRAIEAKEMNKGESKVNQPPIK